jgi:hypothetical protein
MNSDNDDRPPAPEPKPGSPAAWIIGLVFIMAVLGIVLVHSGRDINSRATTADPNTAPNVVTGTSRK